MKAARFRGTCPHCGGEVVTPPPSDASRAYWWGVVVRAYAEHVGEPSLLVAHYQLKVLLGCAGPDDLVPSTSDAASDQAGNSDLILRAAAFLAGENVHVPLPDRLRLTERPA